ncbi:MAG: hypothetical protein HFH03_05880 [Dorea sp.]|jgi:hypothetical protein|nr:hypothetical protein [Dorea sp.]
MKKTKKWGLLCIFTLCIMAGLCFVKPMKAEAASFQTTSLESGQKKIGGTYFWKKNGKIYASKSKKGAGKVIAEPGGWGNIVTNGSVVYYSQLSPNAAYGYVYSVKTSGKDRKRIAKVKDLYQIAAYYNGNLYISYGLIGPDMSTYRLNVKTKKGKKIGKELVVYDQYKQYLLLHHATYMSREGGIRNNAYIYNCKTGKSVKISNKVVSGLNFSSGKVYYAEKINAKSVRIKSCSLTGKNKKTLVKKLSANRYNIGKITSKYVYYWADSKGKQQYYRYDIKKKKAKKISLNTYIKEA